MMVQVVPATLPYIKTFLFIMYSLLVSIGYSKVEFCTKFELHHLIDEGLD